MRKREAEKLLPGAFNPEDDKPCESPNLDEYGRSMTRYRTALNRLTHELVVMDRLISVTSSLLRITQPPKNYKFGIAWWKPSASTELKVPFLVRWMRGINGRWNARRVHRFTSSMIERKGTSAIGADLTERVILVSKDLVEARRQQIDTFRRIGRALVQSQRYWSEKNAGNEKELRRLHQEILSTLRASGYQMTPNVLRYFDLFDGDDRSGVDLSDEFLSMDELRAEDELKKPIGSIYPSYKFDDVDETPSMDEDLVFVASGGPSLRDAPTAQSMVDEQHPVDGVANNG